MWNAFEGLKRIHRKLCRFNPVFRENPTRSDYYPAVLNYKFSQNLSAIFVVRPSSSGQFDGIAWVKNKKNQVNNFKNDQYADITL